MYHMNTAQAMFIYRVDVPRETLNFYKDIKMENSEFQNAIESSVGALAGVYVKQSNEMDKVLDPFVSELMDVLLPRATKRKVGSDSFMAIEYHDHNYALGKFRHSLKSNKDCSLSTNESYEAWRGIKNSMERLYSLRATGFQLQFIANVTESVAEKRKKKNAEAVANPNTKESQKTLRLNQTYGVLDCIVGNTDTLAKSLKALNDATKKWSIDHGTSGGLVFMKDKNGKDVERVKLKDVEKHVNSAKNAINALITMIPSK